MTFQLAPEVLPHDGRWNPRPAGAITNIITIHTFESSESTNSAEAVAAMTTRAPRTVNGRRNVASYHFLVDPDSIIPNAKIGWGAFHAAGANSFAIGIGMAGRAAQTGEQWADAASNAIIDRAAWIAAVTARAQGVPIRRMSVAELRDPVSRAAGGFCSHYDVSLAFRQTTHTDPGPHFPWERFFERVRHHSGVGAAPAWPVFDPVRCQFSLWPFAAKTPISLGARGDIVRYAQGVLACWAGQPVTVDGVFGPQTEAAVENLQRFVGLTVDGKIGAQTWSWIDELSDGKVG